MASMSTTLPQELPPTPYLRVDPVRLRHNIRRVAERADASGVAHALSLLLDEAGWGVIWRTGHYTRSKAVAKAHGLKKDEELLGWLYVGGKPARSGAGRRKAVDARKLLTRMPKPAKD